ncbi:ubiquitin-protein ligase isoform 1 [Galdieria sulphuraria]|uniref:Ubiquitin-protein ligase isoform 1 n=1 Tax=Galdieria sulphuraria TaxID=130081 RepID=M2Y6V6_GALSU|nr:ubiquitin-protein ligase isoform 1 [Galdieria sulphuraria]EME31768.1 ubiquitin-protein ligase isoform 1 [Galdieria sulphuraria]|eukprot:XP_005708288.1 ubiquitin-protein ligase isoform 1 [Galdieria sulphuraria]
MNMEHLLSLEHSHSFIQTWEGTVVVTGRKAKPLWLDGIQLPPSGSGVFSFEARGTSDIDVLFSSYPEKVSEDEQVELEENLHRADYEVVIGSHCNTRSVIRKRGVLRASSLVGVGKESADLNSFGSPSHSYYTTWDFERYWICIGEGLLAVGKGNLGESIFLYWEDPFPIRDALSVGISSWNRPVVFRFIELTPMPEGLVYRTREGCNRVCDLFVGSIYNFSGFFCDTCFESSDGALFPFHGCLVSSLSSRLALAIKEAHSLQTYRDVDYIVQGHRPIFLLNTSNSKCFTTIKKDFEKLPRVVLTSSMMVVAMFLQLLYGIGLDGKCFYDMKSMQSLLQVSTMCHQFIQECKELLKEWDLLHLFPVFGNNVSEHDQDLSVDKSYEHWRQHIIRLVPSHLKVLRETSWLSDVNLIISDSDEMSHIRKEEDELHLDRNAVQQPAMIPAHRIILACRSSYFQNMFSNGMRETFDDNVKLKDTNRISVERMLKIIYFDRLDDIEMNEESHFDSFQLHYYDLRTGDMFYNMELVRIAAIGLKKLVDKWNAGILANLSLKYRIYDLFQTASSFICSHFVEIMEQNDSLLDLEEECLLSILSRIDLICRSEDDVLSLVLKWLKQNSTNDKITKDVFSMIRWPFISADLKAKAELEYEQVFYWAKEVITKKSEKHLSQHYSLSDDGSNESSVLEQRYSDRQYSYDGDIGFSEIFEQPRTFDTRNVQVITVLPCRWIPPRFFSFEERDKWKSLRRDWSLLYGHVPRLKKGEVWIPFIPTQLSLGALFYLSCHSKYQLVGTRINPHKHGVVKISSSSGARFSRLENLVESGANRSSFALPDSSGLAWFSLDFGTKYELACSAYSLVHDGSESNFLRNWCLEGSKDGTQWSILKEHINDKSLQHPLQRSVWKIDNVMSQEFFRYFRILARSRGSRLNLGNLEFYGRLRSNEKLNA